MVNCNKLKLELEFVEQRIIVLIKRRAGILNKLLDNLCEEDLSLEAVERNRELVEILKEELK